MPVTPREKFYGNFVGEPFVPPAAVANPPSQAEHWASAKDFVLRYGYGYAHVPLLGIITWAETYERAGVPNAEWRDDWRAEAERVLAETTSIPNSPTGLLVARVHALLAYDAPAGGGVDLGTVNTAVATAVAATSPQDLRAAQLTARTNSSFELTSVSSDPMVTSAQTFSFSSSLYFPTIFRVDETLGDTAFPYRMSLSTDHDDTTGGIWVLKAPKPEGPWTNPTAGNGQRGAAFVDLVTGRGSANAGQTETPQFVWDPLSRLYYLFYQQQTALNAQATCLAVTPDLVNYEVVGAVIDLPALLWPGGYKPHTGYASVVRRGEGDWVATNLSGAGSFTRYATSYSRDGANWYTDPVQKTGSMNRIGDDDKRVWPNGNVFRVNGELWATGNRGNFVSGANSGDPLTVAGPIAPDLNSWMRPPEPIWQPKYAWEVGGSAARTFIDKDGRLYSVVSNGFKLGLAVANFRVEGIVA